MTAIFLFTEKSMNSNFCPGFNISNFPAHQGLQRFFPEQEYDVRRFLCATIFIPLCIGLGTGTTLAITLDIPPMLGICKALHK
jgi:hypothetical protein